MQPATGRLPPERPVPDPRVTTGVPVRVASARTAATCCAEFTKTTHPGDWSIAAVPSKE